MKDPVRAVIQQVNVLDQAYRITEEYIKKEKVYIRIFSWKIKDGYTAFYRLSQNKNEQTEEAEQKESIEDFGRLFMTVITESHIGLIPVIQRQQGLDNAGNPEEAYKAGNKEKHLPWADLSLSKMTFSKYYADYEKDDKSQQLKKL